ncbi:18065_t:CDS:2 [Dentiscutata erythropus]|uniref:18065_t:CDS:1 n=1 Tax=Dentiscutata erythropus TaxID=1348616 RepID=A0A9N9B6W3_9GLOM|nr:18065_t:CDS:2 [Dentiscutata erythropus]
MEKRELTTEDVVNELECAKTDRDELRQRCKYFRDRHAEEKEKINKNW